MLDVTRSWGANMQIQEVGVGRSMEVDREMER